MAKITLPKKVYLTAMKKEWKISYINSPGKLALIEQPHRKLTIHGKRYSKLAALKLITRWVRMKSQTHLNNTLNRLNRKVKVKFKRLIVRSHDAQWGSYTSTKTLSLNYKLIFLPSPLVSHVIYHELCHVIHLDHSTRFWNKLATYDKNWKKHREALHEADDYIPNWVIF